MSVGEYNQFVHFRFSFRCKMDFGEIESDPLKFCEDFKKFSEKNQDTFVNAQMDIEGQVQIFFSFTVVTPNKGVFP